MDKFVAVILADGFEPLEAVAPIDIMRRAGIDVTLISVGDNLQVDSAQDIMLVADELFSEISLEDFDVVMLPGGSLGVDNLSRNASFCNSLKSYASTGNMIAAICAAPTLLAKLGILDCKTATCYPGCETVFPEGVYADEDVVVCDNIITSAGPGTACSFGLAIVEQLLGTDAASKVAQGMLL